MNKYKVRIENGRIWAWIDEKWANVGSAGELCRYHDGSHSGMTAADAHKIGALEFWHDGSYAAPHLADWAY